MTIQAEHPYFGPGDQGAMPASAPPAAPQVPYGDAHWQTIPADRAEAMLRAWRAAGTSKLLFADALTAALLEDGPAQDART